MKRTLQKQLLIVGAMTAALLASGAAALTYAGNKAADTVAVTYDQKQAPAITPQEAARAVASARDLSTAFRAASEKVLPSVVTIENTPKPEATPGRRQAPQDLNPLDGRNPFEGTPFEDLFRGAPNLGMPAPGPRAGGSGSGVVIDSSGIILTNNHVVAGDGELRVRLHDGREFIATNVWTDPKTDVAIVKIAADGLVPAKLGDSDTVSVGDWVLALGQPFGLEDTVTAGIISAKQRGIGITQRESFLQTDAAINPGNSGGPLVNLDAEVIGVNTAISSRSGGSNGVGFAIPINLAKWIGDQLAANGTVRRAYLGVGIQPVTASLAKQLDVKPLEGVAVTEVMPNTPASKAGLQSGDVIVNYAGVAVSSPSDLQLLVERSDLGRRHELTVVREGERVTLSFIPEAQPAELGVAGTASGDKPSGPARSQLEQFGLEAGTLEANVAEQLGMTGVQGVVVTAVQPGGAADRAGLASGMVITQANRQKVTSLEEFLGVVSKAKTEDGLLLLVRTQQARAIRCLEIAFQRNPSDCPALAASRCEWRDNFFESPRVALRCTLGWFGAVPLGLICILHFAICNLHRRVAEGCAGLVWGRPVGTSWLRLRRLLSETQLSIACDCLSAGVVLASRPGWLTLLGEFLERSLPWD